jgi:hypothetical protein
VANQPLLTTRLLRGVSVFRANFIARSMAGPLSGQDLRDTLADLQVLEWNTEHVDSCERYADAIRRGVTTQAYLDQLRFKARMPEPLEAA